MNNSNKSDKPIQWHHKQMGAHTIMVDQHYNDIASVEWFDPIFWQQNNRVTGTSKGRYTTYFVEESTPEETLNMVLRHYYRGGMVRHFSKDKFVYTGFSNTRCIKELELLKHMYECGLPVPRPIAACVTKHLGLWYSNDILIEQMHDVADGFHHLLTSALPAKTWTEIGSVIKRFHQKGIFHADLNIHNILISNQLTDIYLIDFDRCEIREKDAVWPQQNLDRLKRSLEKEKKLHSTFNFSQQDWQCLLTGYQK